jgi:hypothetical protein
VRRLHPLALQQHLHQRVLQSEHPHRPRHAAATGQQTERHLRYAEFDAVVVGNDPVMAGERDLQPAAERRPVDRGHHRDAERFQDPELALDLLDRLEQLRGVLGTGLGDQPQVATGEEGLFRAGDHDAHQRVLLRLQPLDRRGHRAQVELVHRVRRRVRVVHRQRDDPVVLGPGDHAASLSMMVATPMPPPTHRVARP